MSITNDPRLDTFVYDEFAYFGENAAEAGLALNQPPEVTRIETEVEPGRKLSALRWGSEAPELVFVHGSAQNAHTWDTVLLALGRPAIAVDLAGHGHSDWKDDFGYRPYLHAADVAAAMRAWCEGPVVLVGMSLGGSTAYSVAAEHPELVRALVGVDILPNPSSSAVKDIEDFVSGPQSFPSFGDILDRTMEFNPTRSESSLRRGIMHNAYRSEDGSWQWRYDRRERPRAETTASATPTQDPWQVIDAIDVPFLLMRGGAKGSVVTDESVAELLRRRPNTQVELVEGAGHSIQGDKPLELAALVETFAF